jgi:hypothetical protein
MAVFIVSGLILAMPLCGVVGAAPGVSAAHGLKRCHRKLPTIQHSSSGWQVILKMRGRAAPY